MGQKTHVMHGRDHLPTGADPIPGLDSLFPAGSYQDIILAEPSLIAYWPLDEPSGDALDASGNGYTLTEKGTPIHGEPGPFIDPDDPTSTAFDYAGTETGITVPAQDSFYRNDADLNASTPSLELTFEAWLYPLVLPAIHAGIVTCIDSTYNTYSFQLRHEADGTVIWRGDSVSVTSPSPLELDEWTHVAGTISHTDGTRLYFNGGQVVAGANQEPNNVAVHFMLAAYITAALQGRHFQGRMAQAALYSSALDAGTVNMHYQAGSESGGGSSGWVLTSDGSGGTTWAAPTVEVEF